MTAIWNDEVADWVEANKGSICMVIFRYFPDCSQQEIEEFLRDAYVIAMNAMAKSAIKGKSFCKVFCQDFMSMLHQSRQAMFEIPDPMDDETSLFLHHGQRFTEDLIERFHNESMISKAADTVALLLSPREREIFQLLLGETEHGCCSVIEAANILQVSREAVNQSCLKIIRKIEEAAKLVDLESGVFALDWQQMAKTVTHGRGRLSSVSSAVLRQQRQVPNGVAAFLGESVGATCDVAAA